MMKRTGYFAALDACNVRPNLGLKGTESPRQRFVGVQIRFQYCFWSECNVQSDTSTTADAYNHLSPEADQLACCFAIFRACIHIQEEWAAEPPKASESTGAVTGGAASGAVLVASSNANFDGIDPRVVDAFKLMDKNGDGELSKTEILIALRKQETVRSLLGLSAVKFSEGAEKDAFEAAFSKMDTE